MSPKSGGSARSALCVSQSFVRRRSAPRPTGSSVSPQCDRNLAPALQRAAVSARNGLQVLGSAAGAANAHVAAQAALRSSVVLDVCYVFQCQGTTAHKR
jgi:hypothetical protein